MTSGTAHWKRHCSGFHRWCAIILLLESLLRFLRRHILKVKYISLVNLIADKEVVRELVADTMTVANIRSELESVLYNKVYREQMMVEYERIIQILGPAGASRQAARQMVSLLKK